MPYVDFIDGAGNPLEGQAAFAGESFAFPELEPVELDLGTQFGGQIVRLRFRIGGDFEIASYGWDLDDIAIGGVAPPFPGLAAKQCDLVPTADAGDDRTARAGSKVVLQGRGSDPEGSPVTFRWTAPLGIALDDPSSATPSFRAPVIGDTLRLRFTLIVIDAQGQASAPDDVTVTVLGFRTLR